MKHQVSANGNAYSNHFDFQQESQDFESNEVLEKRFKQSVENSNMHSLSAMTPPRAKENTSKNGVIKATIISQHDRDESKDRYEQQHQQQ